MLATNAMLVFKTRKSSLYFDRSVGRCVCLCMAIYLIRLKIIFGTKLNQCLLELGMRLLSAEGYLFEIQTLIRN